MQGCWDFSDPVSTLVGGRTSWRDGHHVPPQDEMTTSRVQSGPPRRLHGAAVELLLTALVVASALIVTPAIADARTRSTETVSWTMRTVPYATSTYSELRGISCPSSNFCVAVGMYVDGSAEGAPLVVEWNGSRWEDVAISLPAGTTASFLSSVACTSATFCIAVGQFIRNQTTGSFRPLSEVWNGSAWAPAVVPMPSDAATGMLKGVACLSADSCTSVGNFAIAGGAPIPLADQWNGTSWVNERTPATQIGGIGLNAVSCLGSDCIAVGGSTDGVAGAIALAEEWDGNAWLLTAQPLAAELEGISCLSPTSCIAVGWDGEGWGTAEAWDGTSWRAQSIPTGFGAFVSVACLSSTECLAVGDLRTPYSFLNPPTFQLEVGEWNGTSWTHASLVGLSGLLGAITCTSTSSCVAVGQRPDSAALATTWNGTDWAAESSPSPTGNFGDEANGVSCPTTSWCALVGVALRPNHEWRPFTDIWNGQTWVSVRVPEPANANRAEFDDVSCTSTAACVAVGQNLVQNPGSNQINALAGKWNGRNWTLLPIVQPAGATDTALTTVSCGSTGHCIAGGSDTVPGQQATGLTEYWNGETWTIVPIPGIGAGQVVTSVSCSGPTICMAVGSDATPFAALWDGVSWHLQAETLPPGTSAGSFDAVSCNTATECTAVGTYVNGTSAGVVVERWSSGRPRLLPVPSVASIPDVRDFHLSCHAAAACALVGYEPGTNVYRAVAYVWNGSGWVAASLPRLSTAWESYLHAVSCPSSSLCVAAGTLVSTFDGEQAVVERGST